MLSVFTEASETTANSRRFKQWREPETLSGYTTETEEEPSYQTPTEEEPRQETTEMSTSTNSTPKEFNINKPKEFDGNRKDVQSFILDCKVYLQVNQHIYTTDDSKVAFILSFMN